MGCEGFDWEVLRCERYELHFCCHLEAILLVDYCSAGEEIILGGGTAM